VALLPNLDSTILLQMTLSDSTVVNPTTVTSNNTQIRHIRLALLVNDTPVAPVVAAHGDYPVIYKHWLEQCKPSTSKGSKEDVSFSMDSFDVVNRPGVYPDPKEYDAIMLTGSGKR
jgi:translation initiation factor 2 gamma subunit (eIF-2gamma)